MIYKYTKKTDGLAKDAVIAKAGLIDYTNLFVVEDNKAIGVIHIHDLLKAGIA